MPVKKASEKEVQDTEVDNELVERVKRGDKRAFDLLVTKYQRKVYTLVMRYVRNHGDAEDLTQEAFIKAYRALPTFRGDSQFYTWIYRIAVNTAMNYLSAQSIRPPADDVEVEVAEQIDAGVRLQDHATPLNRLLEEEIAITIRDTIDELPEEMRIAITLRELEGLSYEEIAKAMDCPVGTVRSRIFRAREAIDARLKPLLD